MCYFFGGGFNMMSFDLRSNGQTLSMYSEQPSRSKVVTGLEGMMLSGREGGEG